MIQLTVFLAWIVAILAMGKKAKKYNHRRAFWTYVSNNYSGGKEIAMFLIFWPCCVWDKFIHEERKFLE